MSIHSKCSARNTLPLSPVYKLVQRNRTRERLLRGTRFCIRLLANSMHRYHPSVDQPFARYRGQNQSRVFSSGMNIWLKSFVSKNIKTTPPRTFTVQCLLGRVFLWITPAKRNERFIFRPQTITSWTKIVGVKLYIMALYSKFVLLAVFCTITVAQNMSKFV